MKNSVFVVAAALTGFACAQDGNQDSVQRSITARSRGRAHA